MTRVDADRLEAFVAQLLTASNVPSDSASQVARSLVDADLRGHGSHGVIRVPQYLDWLEEGKIDPEGTPEITQESATHVHVEGNHAFGQVVGRELAQTLAAKATDGVGVVGVRNATHLGRIGEWAERVTDRGLLFAAFVNTGGAAQTVALPGSADRKLATNPIGFGIPTFETLPFPLVVDCATSQVAHGKITKRAASGEPLPAAWTTTADGTPVRDAEAFEHGEGALLPLGGRASGHKGFGLAVVAELFAGLVGDGPVAGTDETAGLNAATFVAIDPLTFTTEARAAERVETLTSHLRSAEQHENVPVGDAAVGEEMLLPGEAEYRRFHERRGKGIPLSAETRNSLRERAEEHGIDTSLVAE